MGLELPSLRRLILPHLGNPYIRSLWANPPYGIEVKPEEKIKDNEKNPRNSTATLAAVGAGGLLVGASAGAYAGHELSKLPYTPSDTCDCNSILTTR